jgi:hypothetical protein
VGAGALMDLSARGRLSAWIADLAAVIAETWGLSAIEADAVLDELGERLSGCRLVPLDDGLPAPTRVRREQDEASSLRRIADAQSLAEATARLREGKRQSLQDRRLSGQDLAVWWLDELSATYRVPLEDRIRIIAAVTDVAEAHRLDERPVHASIRPLLELTRRRQPASAGSKERREKGGQGLLRRGRADT